MAATPELGRRLRAARELAGLRSVEALAAAINEPGLGTQKLRELERGEKTPAPRDLAAIADACGVSRSFFTAPDAAVRNPPEEQQPAPALEGAVERLGQQEAQIMERLERIEDALSSSALLDGVRLEVREWLAALPDEAAAADGAAPRAQAPGPGRRRAAR